MRFAEYGAQSNMMNEKEFIRQMRVWEQQGRLLRKVGVGPQTKGFGADRGQLALGASCLLLPAPASMRWLAPRHVAASNAHVYG